MSKVRATQRFLEMGLPTSAMEEWKYVDLDLGLSQNTPSARLGDARPYVSKVVTDSDYKIVLTGTGIDFDRSFLPSGVTVSLAETVAGATVVSAVVDRESNPLVLKAISECVPVCYVTVADGLVLDRPVHVLVDYLDASVAWVQPVIVGMLGEKSTASLVMHPVKFDGSGRVNYVMIAHLGQGASFEGVYLNCDARDVQFTSVSARLYLEANATCEFMVASHCTGRGRIDVSAVTSGEGAKCEIKGVSVLDGDDQLHVRTNVFHDVAGCYSRQTIKAILDGRSMTEYHGAVDIALGADLTDSAQSNENLLISDEARVVSRPQLRVHTDDVKAAHGANVGQLDERHLFYLMSRGISNADAKKLLCEGFVKVVIDTISSAPIRSYLLHRLIENRAVVA